MIRTRRRPQKKGRPTAGPEILDRWKLDFGLEGRLSDSRLL